LKDKENIGQIEPSSDRVLKNTKATKNDEENIWQVEPSSDRVFRNTKATKNDDAEVLVYLWNESIVADGDPRKLLALDVIRHFALRWWKKNTTRDFLRWLNQKYPLALRPSGGYKKRTERLVLTACLDVQILHGGNRMWDLSLYSGGGLRNTGQLYVME
jgi:hypothetical protein